MTACSTLELAKGAKDLVMGGSEKGGLAVDTELTVGDKAEDNDNELQLGDRNDNRQEAKSISNVVTNNNTDKFMLIMLLIGWILPSPTSIGKWIWSKIPWVGGK